MSDNTSKFVLDANAFIQAKRRFYPFEICPGYWAALKWHQQQGNLCSIDKVQLELQRGGDDLTAWVDSEFGEDSFAHTDDADVIDAYKEMLAWVIAQSQFNDPAKARYQEVADGWLAAFAKAKNFTVVTLEEFDPLIRKSVPLPNVCKAFDVEWITPYEMLRRLGVKLTWTPQK